MNTDSNQLTLSIFLRDKFPEKELETFRELQKIMERIGLSMNVASGEEPLFTISGNKTLIEEKKNRNAGRKQVEAKDTLTVGEVRDRIKNGEKVGDIATELGMSQRTLYRRLEKEDHEYI